MKIPIHRGSSLAALEPVRYRERLSPPESKRNRLKAHKIAKDAASSHRERDRSRAERVRFHDNWLVACQAKKVD